MDIRYDPDADAAYIRLRSGKVFRTDDLGGGYFVDFNRRGKPLGIEVLFVSKKKARDAAESRIVDVPVPPRVWRVANAA